MNSVHLQPSKEKKNPLFFLDLILCTIPYTAVQSLSSLGNHPGITGKHRGSSRRKSKIIIDPALDQFGETDWATSADNLRLHFTILKMQDLFK